MTMDEDRDAFAAEYALGTLDADERAQAEALMLTDAAFVAAVRQWERRLGELNVLVAPVEPPEKLAVTLLSPVIVTVQVAPFPMRDGVVLAVSDSGRGIEAEHLERIFDPFFTTKEEGTGLGLPICKQIVEQHGGTIRIESEPGHGTRVMVLLPDLAAEQKEHAHGAVAAG